MLLPALSVVVTLASMVIAIGRQGGAGDVDAERAVGDLPVWPAPTVRVTVSPFCTSPPTVPVMAIFVPASAALTMSSEYDGIDAIVAVGASVSTP